MKWDRCGRVSPFWVDIGWVKWVGTSMLGASREKLYNIEYRRCTLPPVPGTYLCPEHGPKEGE